MSLSREIVDLATRMPTDIPGFNPFAPEAAELLESFGAFPVLDRLQRRFGPDLSPAALLLCLQVLEVHRQSLQPRVVTAEFVATFPALSTPGARPTARVIEEMLGRATTEIIAAGYEIRDERVLGGLHAAAARQVDVTLICDRGRASGTAALEGWPTSGRQPRIFHDRSRDDATPFASMHCKTLLVDGEELLTTSANFTFHGLSGNIEFGVHLSGTPAAQARDLFRELLQSDLFEQVRR